MPCAPPFRNGLFLECFTYALNSLGCLLSSGDFIDITTDEKLERITPANLLDPPSKGNPHSAHGSCLRCFPKTCAHWSANRDLLALIIEYHDATEHRHSAVVGQGLECHLLKLAPKQPMGDIVFDESRAGGETKGFVPHNEEHSLQSIATAYRTFVIEWLRIARQELEAGFGQSLPAAPS